MWLIEPTDAPLPQHQQDPIEPKEIVNDFFEGQYILHNVKAGNFIALNPGNINAFLASPDNELPVIFSSTHRTITISHH
jgi:hypothetical protein